MLAGRHNFGCFQNCEDKAAIWLGAVSEKSEKISTLKKYYLPFFHQLMAIFAESEHANSMTLIMNINIKKD